MSERHTLIVDANILIDLAHANALSLLVDVASNRGGALLVTQAVVDEIAPREGIDETLLQTLGVKVIDASSDTDVAFARLAVSGQVSSQLSDTDTQLLAVALARHYDLWTNDQSLLCAACAFRLTALRLFAPLITLVHEGKLSAEELRTIASAIRARNRYITQDVIDRLHRAIADW